VGKGYVDDLHNLPQGRLYASVKTTVLFKISPPFATAKPLWKKLFLTLIFHVPRFAAKHASLDGRIGG